MNEHALEVLEYARVLDLLAGYASSSLGKREAEALRSLTEHTRIEHYLAETTELKRLLSPNRALPLGGLHDLTPLLATAEAGIEPLTPAELLRFKETLRACRLLREFLARIGPDYPHLTAWTQSLPAYVKLEEKLERSLGDSGTIQNRASSQLRGVRRQIQTLRAQIRSKLQALIRTPGINPHLQDTVVRERKGRPVIAVKGPQASRVAGIRRDRSDSGQTIFVEPEGIREMGDALESALNAERAEVVRILLEITGMIAAGADSFRKTLRLLAHIDLTYAKVRFSREYGMRAPKLNGEGRVVLRAARHPLLLDQQKKVESGETGVVPIDLRLGDDFLTLIITGPNTGGKTVTLKTLGLLVLMAQSGMHIPAEEGTTLPIFTEVFADIGDEQSIEQSLSTFSSHLRNISEILHAADSSNLVLLDELGGGTDPAEGAALARAVLEHLHRRQVRTAVTTHISDLKHLGYTVPGIENASVEFDVQTLRPTYRLLIGTPGSSNALTIARRMGLPDEVLEVAAEHSQQGESRMAELLNQLQSSKAATETNRQLAERSRQEAEQLEEEHHTRLAAIIEREAQLGTELRREAFSALRDLKLAIGQLLRDPPSEERLLHALEKMSEQIAEHLAPNPNDETAGLDVPPPPEPGDTVYVRTFDQQGTLCRIDEQRQKAVVQLGPLQMTVPLDAVEALA